MPACMADGCRDWKCLDIALTDTLRPKASHRGGVPEERNSDAIFRSWFRCSPQPVTSAGMACGHGVRGPVVAFCAVWSPLRAEGGTAEEPCLVRRTPRCVA